MTLDEVFAAYARRELTKHELFASLTRVLSDDPPRLVEARQRVADETPLAADFEEWLEALKARPLVLLGHHLVDLGQNLIAALGAPLLPAPLRTSSGPPYYPTGVVRLSSQRATGTPPLLAACARPVHEEESTRVVIQPFGEALDELEPTLLALLAFADPAAARRAMTGVPYELLHAGEVIGTLRVRGWVPAGRAHDRSVDDDFLVGHEAVT